MKTKPPIRRFYFCFKNYASGIHLLRKRVIKINVISFFDLLLEIFFRKDTDIGKIYSKGLLAVKIGQIFALRIDFLSPSKCKDLSLLYNSNTPITSGDFFKFSRQGFSDQWMENFKSIDSTPMASASIAQVHRGLLKNGSKVVIKTIKKDRAINFTSDVNNVKKFFKFIISIYPKLKKVADPIELLNMIEKNTSSELDLKNEIENQRVLHEIWDSSRYDVDLKELKFPILYENLSNNTTLVSQEIEGSTFEELLNSSNLEYRHLLNLFKIQGFYMFSQGVFHGDLHPANVMLKDEDIYFIDCGALGYAEKKLRTGLFNFMKHLCLYEFDGCAQSLNSMSDIALENEAFKHFSNDFLLLYSGFENKTVSEKSLTRQMMETIKLGVNHGMSFPKGIFDIIKSLMYMDGMVLKCNPDAILMKDMRPYMGILEKYIYEGDEYE